MRISKHISRQTQFRLEQVLFKVLYYFCWLVPAGLVLGIGRSIGMLAWLLKARKKTVLKNLAIAFGDRYTRSELEDIARRCYQHFGAEMMRVLILDKEASKSLEDWIDVEGLELLKNREQRGGILVGGHIGCWEIGSFVLPKLGEELTIFTGTHTNQRADQWLNEIRSKAGAITAGTGDDRTELYRAAQSGLVALIGDQSPGQSPVMVEFFGMSTDAAQGPALLSLLHSVDLFYFSSLKKDGRIKVRIQKVDFDRVETRKENVSRLTQAFFRILEAEIRENPEQYFWMHKRWKRCPGVEYGEVDVLF